MNPKRMAAKIGAIAHLFACAANLPAAAQTALTSPPGYAPGWRIAVYKAGGALGQKTGARLTSFLAPAAGFDMGSYRDSLQSGLRFGLAYEAEGLLNIAGGGPHRVGVRLDWNAPEPGSPEAHCAASLSIDGASLADWSGSVSTADGHHVSGGAADLQPGLHPTMLRVACDQPLGAGLRVALLLKTPSDADLRPLGAIEILHAGTAATATAPSSAPPVQAPAQVYAPPPPEAAPAYAPPEGGQRLVATIDLSVRERPDRRSPRLGRLVAGQEVETAGAAEDPAWTRLASGGYAETGFLRPIGEAGPARPGGRGQHRVGDCRPYTMPAATEDGGARTITGKACLQADGTWRVVH